MGAKRSFVALTGLALAALACAAASPSWAATLRVPDDLARIGDALGAAAAGDTIRVAAGLYSSASNGETFPLVIATSNLVLEGAGAEATVVDAMSQASVLRIAAPGVRVTGMSLRGGYAVRGGGIDILAAAESPQIDHLRLLDNGAESMGAAIYAAPGTVPWIHHNVVWRSFDTAPAAPGDPHGIQLDSANGLVEHNLVGRGDSNSLIVTGTGNPVIRDNIFFENGTPGVRGRGICALGGAQTVIAYNLFFGNAIAALVIRVPTGFQDVSAAEANDYDPSDGIYANLDGDPQFVNADASDWRLLAGSPAIDGADPSGPVDPDGTPPDIGPIYFDHSLVDVEPSTGGRGWMLHPAVPNPSMGPTELRFSLPSPASVRLLVLDARGRHLATLVEATLPAGPHRARWNGVDRTGSRVPPGLYFARLECPGGRLTGKIAIGR